MTSDLFTFLLLTSFLENKQTAEAKEQREKWLHGLGTLWEEENSKNRRRKSASYSPHTLHYKARFGSIVKLFVAVVLKPVSFKSTNGSNEKKAIENLKKAGLMIAGAAVQKLMTNLKEEQEILMNLADMLIEGYAAESALLRVEKLVGMWGEEKAALHIDLARIYLHKAIEKSAWAGKQAIYAFAEGDEMRMMLIGLKRFTKIEPFNLKEARRRVADYLLDKNDYTL